jgi:hypothetical protein
MKTYHMWMDEYKPTINDQKDLAKSSYKMNKKVKYLITLLHVDKPLEHVFNTLMILNTTCINLQQVHVIHILQNMNCMNSYNHVPFLESHSIFSLTS